jgi:5-methylcytosine-specific restriction endonuclease McrA
MTTRGDLTPALRLALYEEWDRRCIWGREPLRFNELEIDHLIPKSLSGEELDRILADYGLPSSFDLYALTNLVPSCRFCNATKGSKPVPSAPIIKVHLEKARKLAPKIQLRADEFERDQDMDSALARILIARPSGRELESIIKELKGEHREYLAAIFHEPIPPRLKRSKGRLNYDGFSDKEQMLILIDSWVRAKGSWALDVVQEGFDGGDTPPTSIAPVNVNFLAYAKKLGDYLASVTFNIDYIYITEDYRAEGNIEQALSLWIKLDSSRREIIDVAIDHLDTLEACEGFKP